MTVQFCLICGRQGERLDEPVEIPKDPKLVTEIDHPQFVAGLRSGNLKVAMPWLGEFYADAFQLVYPQLKSRLSLLRLIAFPICLLLGVWLLRSLGDPDVASQEIWKIAIGGLLLPIFAGEAALRAYRNWMFRKRLVADADFFDKVIQTRLIRVRRR